MSNHRIATCIIAAALLLTLVPLYAAKGQEYYEYSIQLQSDGSAYWTITQFSSANATVETWEGLQQKIFTLVDDASALTHRDFDVDENSLQINTTLSFDSKTTEYSFLWRNFSVKEGDRLVFGDVFEVPNFFIRLFGDASLQATCPEGYTVQSVYPTPREQTDRALKWARTQDLAGADTKVVLTKKTGAADTGSFGGGLLAVGALAAGLVVAFLVFRRYRQRLSSVTAAAVSSSEPSAPYLIESEADKILRLLRGQGGVMRQSDIAEKTRFSKAKTSQLLSEMESQGILARYKKGRDKIVTLSEGRKGEKND
ncbi:MAG: helix-turn-helix domain-containing protein [Candidatus Bathyarchaeota archaeon]|nr:helix-turn-helix domain-containing protein [Candidatus Bathyarchaeota archaeon]